MIIGIKIHAKFTCVYPDLFLVCVADDKGLSYYGEDVQSSLFEKLLRVLGKDFTWKWHKPLALGSQMLNSFECLAFFDCFLMIENTIDTVWIRDYHNKNRAYQFKIL